MSTIKQQENVTTYDLWNNFLQFQTKAIIESHNISTQIPEKIELHELCDIMKDHNIKQFKVNNSHSNAATNVTDVFPVKILDKYIDNIKAVLLIEAAKYHIPFSSENTDFYKLQDDVEEMKDLYKQTLELGIMWDFNYYDPNGLRQEIEAAEDREYLYGRELKKDYYASR